MYRTFVIQYWFSALVLQVHGAFAGYSGITVGICNTHYAYFPITEVISHPQLVDPNSRMWHRCLTSTGQPDFIWLFSIFELIYSRGLEILASTDYIIGIWIQKVFLVSLSVIIGIIQRMAFLPYTKNWLFV